MTADCLFVLGMHRSGTSALAGALHRLGVPLGRELIPADPDVNARGFWEHRRLSETNERLLRVLGVSWLEEGPLPALDWTDPRLSPLRHELLALLRQEFAAYPLWAVKDPRLCRVLPLWNELMPALGCRPHAILIVREPAEVAASLLRRDRMPRWKGALLWLRYLLEAERHSRDMPRVVITYRQLLSGRTDLLAEVAGRLGLSWPLPPERARQAVDGFLDDSLRHQRETGPAQEPCLALAAQAYAQLSEQPEAFWRLAADFDARLSALVEERRRSLAEINELLLALEQARYDLLLAKQEAAVLGADLARIKATASWRLTKPLRLLSQLGRRFARPASAETDQSD